MLFHRHKVFNLSEAVQDVVFFVTFCPCSYEDVNSDQGRVHLKVVPTTSVPRAGLTIVPVVPRYTAPDQLLIFLPHCGLTLTVITFKQLFTAECFRKQRYLG